VGLKQLQVSIKHIHQHHTAEMVVVETLWQLHTLTVLTSWLYWRGPS